MLTEEERRELRYALSSLPYSGRCHFKRIETVADVVENLQAFGKELAAVSARTIADGEELHALRRQRATVRDFLGTG